jgi:EpsI family protein
MTLTSIHGRRLAAVVALVVAVLAFYWPAIVPLAEAWSDTGRLTYTHGYLVAAVAAWLLWRARERLAEPEQTSPSPLQVATRVLILLALVIAWQIAYRAGIQLAQQMLLPPILVAAIFVVLGARAARAAVLPVGYLYFAIPIWDYFNFAALWSTTLAVRFMLMAVGVPAYFEGNSVQLPAGQFEIAGGCSGMHFIIVSLALATLLGELRRDRWPLRAAWWLIAFALAMLCNWVRVFVVILAGHLTHMQHYLVRESHYGFGWLLFALVIIALIVIDRRLPLARRAQEERHIRVAARGTSPGSAPRMVAAALAAATLALPLAVNRAIDTHAAAPFADVTPDVTNCSPTDRIVGHWQPRQRAADGESRRAYSCGGRAVETYAAWYRDQRQGKKLGGYDNRLQGDAELLAAAVESAGQRHFLALHLRRDGREELMWLAYRVGEREFTSATRAQLWYSLRALRTLDSPMSVAIAARAPCEPDCTLARQTLFRFMQNGGIP